MDTTIVREAQRVAALAAREAGALLKKLFEKLDSSAFQHKDESGDLVTEADHRAEAIILGKIKQAFPGHQVISEEAGDNRLASDWLWLVDPLDGTNNFAVGMPLFAVSITLMYQRETVMAVIYEPLTDRLYEAVASGGFRCNGRIIRMGEPRPFKRATVGWIQGHKVQQEQRAVRLRQHIDANTKRMMRLWAPTLQWSMLAKGDLDAIILYNSEGEDLYSGMLMVREAGGVITDYDGRPFAGMSSEPYLIACHPQHLPFFRGLVHNGLVGK
ncbi:inositol monophosphatase family protein [Paenibacillus sp. Leaf72]|uniref:inositol monophosphatase family protein n=1 Tax=Paenibacillus sp. Leaf72 TaxID=1736234 RepID=UPI0007004C2C|nr:inositol monophosphatase [Paenibacillus sp. Leaf72]KQO10900.1 inositol phosphatase [Paenibacillus sp. Leaf72]